MNPAPLIVFEDRPSDSPFIERVWRSHSQQTGEFQSIAACHWEMVVGRSEGRISMIVRGPETQATTAECPAEAEWFAIRFQLGTCMPLLPPVQLMNRNDVILPNASRRSFWLQGSAWEFPTFENAEIFVHRLYQRGLIIEDPLVKAIFRGESRTVTARTEQRRFLQVTGITYGTAYQIERARQATLLLGQGTSILDASFQAGYYDQAHFTRSLKRWMGQTPSQIVRAERQLSFLYNKQEPLTTRLR